jgi:hypothetical protein
MKHIYIVILIFYCTQIFCMEYKDYGEPNLFLPSDSDNSDDTFDPMEEPFFYPTKIRKKQSLVISIRTKIDRNDTQKHKTTFWQRLIHMAASVMSSGKFVVTQKKYFPTLLKKRLPPDYTQDTIYFSRVD